MTISATLMAVSLAGIYISDTVEKALLEKQERENTTDQLGIDTIDSNSRGLETRGSSTDRVRLEERARR